MTEDHDIGIHANGPTEVAYVCPMHSDVRQSGPGDCPKCGMHLVPEGEVDAHAHHHHSAHHGATDDNGEYDVVPAGYDGPVYTCPMHPQVRQTHPAPARSAAWGWSWKAQRWWTRGRTRNWWISPGAYG